jgi:transcriptional regulator with XRE-family HTH domain
MIDTALITQRIRFLRKNKGYTQQEVADMLGVGKSAYNSYEKGTRSISVQSIIKLSHFYKVSSDFILGLSNDTKFKTKSGGYITFKGTSIID